MGAAELMPFHQRHKHTWTLDERARPMVFRNDCCNIREIDATRASAELQADGASDISAHGHAEIHAVVNKLARFDALVGHPPREPA